MNPEQARALTSLALFAAFVDGGQSDDERAKVKEAAEAFGDPDISAALRRVLLKETTPAAEALLLGTEELRLLAWESALGVVQSDGASTDEERRFLVDLASALHRPAASALRDIEDGDAIALSSIDTRPIVPLPVVVPGAAANDARADDLDAKVLRYAILTGAIELLPQGLATLAIIPLQTKMVYEIGHAHGHSLSASSIKEFAATVGIGMTGQVVERFARKFLGSIGRGLLGGVGGLAASLGTGPAFTFATTYAMGMVAKAYYAGGRTLSIEDLRRIFAQQVETAKGFYQRYEPQVRQTAATTNPIQLLQSLRG